MESLIPPPNWGSQRQPKLQLTVPDAAFFMDFELMTTNRTIAPYRVALTAVIKKTPIDPQVKELTGKVLYRYRGSSETQSFLGDEEVSPGLSNDEVAEHDRKQFQDGSKQLKNGQYESNLYGQAFEKFSQRGDRRLSLLDLIAV